jgi:alpha-1,6-mannosyltransferase
VSHSEFEGDVVVRSASANPISATGAGVQQPEPAAEEAVRRRADAKPRPQDGGNSGHGINGAAYVAVWCGAVSVAVLLLALAVRLPWNGDLGLHAAVIERLRANLLHPGNPMVDAAIESPYYSPWTVLQALVAKATGLGTFTVLRLAALTNVALLLSGIWRFTRVLSTHRAAPPVALLCLTLLWGPPLFAWSGLLELGSLAIAISYPSTFIVALAFHFWASLHKALRRPASWPAFTMLGALWGVMLLVHQFSGMIATFGAVAVVVAARPGREIWLRVAAGILAGTVVALTWPYYSLLALLGNSSLDPWSAALYENLPSRLVLMLPGVVALWFRFMKDRRDPLVIFFVLGAATVGYGWLFAHWSWGRALPAVLIPAQLAIALTVVAVRKRAVRETLCGLLVIAFAFGAWTQSTALGYVVAPEHLPAALREKAWPSWQGYAWTRRWVGYGETVMTSQAIAFQLPAHGAYTVAPAFPDPFLNDSQARWDATNLYFSPISSRNERLAALHRYHVSWVLQQPGQQGGLSPLDPALSKTATGPGGEVLYHVIG